MANRQLVLLGALWVTLLLGVASLVYRWWVELPVSTVIPKVAPHAVTPADFEAIRRSLDAENIEDKVQRCLAYPNPQGSKWDPAVVNAFCRLSRPEILSMAEIRKALDEGRSKDLDRAFSSYEQRTYEPGQHGFLTRAYRYTFQEGDDETGRLAQRWVDLAPGSAFALVARGLHNSSAAYDARGGNTARKTAEVRFARAHEIASAARADLEEALRRDPRLITAYHGLMPVAQLMSDRALLVSARDRALALDPADHWVYDDWLNAASTMWGGSPALVQEAVDAAKAHESENPLLTRVAARPMCDKADYVGCPECGDRKSAKQRAQYAVSLYERALVSTPATCALRVGGYAAEWAGDDLAQVRINSQAFRFLEEDEWIFRRAIALQHLGKPDWGLEGVDRIIASQPKNIEALMYRGWVLEGAHRFREAELTFLSGLKIDPSHPQPTTELVNLYMKSLHEPEKARAIVARLQAENPRNPRAWLLESVLYRHEEEARCRELLRKYLALVDEAAADPYEQQDIDRARQRLAELEKKLGPSETR